MKLNLKKRFSNKIFCAAFIGAVVLLVQQVELWQYLPDNLMDIVNPILTLLVMLGIVIDPTTEVISDSQTVLKNKTSDELRKEIEEIEELKEKSGE